MLRRIKKSRKPAREEPYRPIYTGTISKMGQLLLTRCSMALLFWLGLPHLHGESYQEWLQPPQDFTFSAVVVEFSPFVSLSPRSPEHQPPLRSLSLANWRSQRIGPVTRPGGGFMGTLQLRPASSASFQYPLSLALIYSEVFSPDLDGFGQLDLTAQMRRESYRHTFHVGEDSPDLPLVVPVFSGYRSYRHGYNSSSYFSCRLEIQDASGKILGHYLLLDLVSVEHLYGSVGWVMNESEADPGS